MAGVLKAVRARLKLSESEIDVCQTRHKGNGWSLMAPYSSSFVSPSSLSSLVLVVSRVSCVVHSNSALIRQRLANRSSTHEIFPRPR